jgi:hypothetical protein
MSVKRRLTVNSGDFWATVSDMTGVVTNRQSLFTEYFQYLSLFVPFSTANVQKIHHFQHFKTGNLTIFWLMFSHQTTPSRSNPGNGRVAKKVVKCGHVIL